MFDKLPDSIILTIFSYLSVKERCLCQRVCKRWCQIVGDTSLWRHVDLLPYSIPATQMWRLLRAHFSPCLTTLKLAGFAQMPTSRKRKKTSITESLTRELCLRCRNLTVLHLHNFSVENIHFHSLPTTIQSLSITQSTWVPGWFEDKPNHLPNLHTLDISGAVEVGPLDFRDISKMVGLVSLSLSKCRIDSVGVLFISKGLAKLEYLDLSGVFVSSADSEELFIAVDYIFSRNLVNLKELDLTETMLYDSCLAEMSACYSKLKVLHIDVYCSCSFITVDGIRALLNLDNLKMIKFKRATRLNIEKLTQVLTKPDCAWEVVKTEDNKGFKIEVVNGKVERLETCTWLMLRKS